MPERPSAPQASPVPVQTILAFDFGRKRIGLASGDTLTRTAGPRPAVGVGPAGADWAAIEREVRGLQPHLFIVGAPYNADGSPGALATAASRFAAELERRFGLPVKRVDERFSSLQANERLKSQRASGERRRRIRRDDIDSAAAAVILERWLSGETIE
jgi:putative Holliday junction resolvase